MAKKIVRGITDVKTINNQDYDTNNVNDLLSDGQYNYIHRKKGKGEEYHNLTDNIKTLSSDNTELLAVTNNNKTTNTALLSPKHDKQKEQVIESTRNTVTINHGKNGTAEKTTVDTNPEKVLEHENLLTDYGISKNTTGNTTKLGVEYTLVDDGFDLNTLTNGLVRGQAMVNSPSLDAWYLVESFGGTSNTIQKAMVYDEGNNMTYIRWKNNGLWEPWREQVGDKSVIDALLAQKEQVLESTRNTVTIHHGTNGTAEKTTVDTNPQKVLEHENLISDSEYITLNHQQGENTTHIQTTALEHVLSQILQAISSGSFVTSTIQYFSDTNFKALKQNVRGRGGELVTFSFECYNVAETVLTGDLKIHLNPYVEQNTSISNGALTITNDGTTMKLINSAPSENVRQHATFTFDNRPNTV